MAASLKNINKIASSYLTPDTTTIDGIEKALKAWFVFEYKTTLNDDRLLDMHLEELLILYQMHRFRENPLQQDEEKDSYESWLEEEMGEDYESEEEMIAIMEEYEKKELEKAKRIKEVTPDTITTDFGNLENN